MNYKLRNATQPKNVETCLEDILTLRGVEDIDSLPLEEISEEDLLEEIEDEEDIISSNKVEE